MTRIRHQAAVLFRSLFKSRQVDADIAEELRFHLDRETEANVQRGMSPSQAFRAARITVGSLDDAREAARDERPGSRLRQFATDIRFGARLLRKAPAFAIASVTIVALGIGASTAIFSVVYGVLLRPLPYDEPERLVSLRTSLGQFHLQSALLNGADHRAIMASTRVFEDIALVKPLTNYNLTGDGTEPERLLAGRTSANLLRVLGVTPLLGRGFTAEEEQPDHENAVLLSYGLWQRRFGGDPSIVGRTIQLSGVPTTVVGVMRPEFTYPSRAYQIWVPLSIDPRELAREYASFNFLAVGRIKPGTTVEQAQADLNATAARLAHDVPRSNKDVTFVATSMLDEAVEGVKRALYVLLGAVSCLLLIACLNVANLLGARAAGRSGEFAVRLALGASRHRLVSQAFAEVVPILAIGGAVGVVAAVLAVRAFVATAPNLPRIEDVRVSWQVLAFSVTMLTLTGLIASLLSASQAWRSDFTAVTKEGSRSTIGGRRQATARRVLVVLQIAFAVPLIAGATMLVRSFANLLQVNPGIRTEGALSMLVAIPRAKFPTDDAVASFTTRLVESVRDVVGVRSVAMVNRLPLGGVGQVSSVSLETEQPDGRQIGIDSRSVTPGYFATIGIPLEQGRDFTSHDDMKSRRVVVVDEQFAMKYWPAQRAIGKHLRSDTTYEVIGVVGHVQHEGLDVDPRPQVYWCYLQRPQDRMALVVRGSGPPATLITPVIRAIRSVDPDQPVYDVRTMRDVLDRSLAQRRVTMILLTTFGFVALTLAIIGVYGVVAFGVAQRLREFGIRIALGADRRRVASPVILQGSGMATIGAIVGLIAAYGLGGIMSSLVYGVDSRDMLSFIGAGGLLVVVAALASYLPARRAANIDPAITLRSE